MLEKLVISGTASAYPEIRNKSSFLLITTEGNYILDCGCPSGQLVKRTNFIEIEGLFISHFHVDHLLYLFDYLQSWKILGRKKELKIIGPDKLENWLNLTLPQLFLYPENVPFPIKILKYHSINHSWIMPFKNKHLEKEKYLIWNQQHQNTLSLDSYSFLIKGINNNLFFLSGDIADENDLTETLLKVYIKLTEEKFTKKNGISLDKLLLKFKNNIPQITFILDGEHLEKETYLKFQKVNINFYLTHYQNKKNNNLPYLQDYFTFKL